MRRQLEISNEVAAELAGSGDSVLRALEGHVECSLYLRGNIVTLLDLRRLFGDKSEGIVDLKRAILVGSGDARIGVLSEEILGTVQFQRDALQKLPATRYSDRFVRGLSADLSLPVGEAAVEGGSRRGSIARPHVLDRPERLLAICQECRGWLVLDLASALILELPRFGMIAPEGDPDSSLT